MKKNEYKKFIGNTTLTVSQAMQAIDNNSFGILFLVNDMGILEACITDGDIRRFLLAGRAMTEPVINAANHNPKVAHSENEAKKLYHKKNYIVVPIVDDNGHPIDLYFGENFITQPKNPLHVPVVINAGGRGTRLDPFTRVLPKPLIPVGEIPIIEHIMKEYQSYKCEDFHIIVNYKRELMKAYFSDNDDIYNITWYDEDSPLGTGGGLSLLQGVIKETFFFANCDALLKTDYEKMFRFHKDNGNIITMICAYKNVSIPYGVVEIGKDGIIKEMKEKPTVSFLTNTGIYIVEPEVIDDIEPGVSIGFPDIIERERKNGKKVAVYPVSGEDWMDMGQISELEKMRVKLYGE